MIRLMERVAVPPVIWVRSARKSVQKGNMVRIAWNSANARMGGHVTSTPVNVRVPKDGPVLCKWDSFLSCFHFNHTYCYRCEESCDPGTHGENCQAKCRCQNGANCHPETGLCICTPGWTGTVCANRCVPGTYGENCSKLCECFNNGSCHHITGECLCAPGYTGNKCLDSCPQNMYGLNCTETCRCKNGAACDISSGFCLCDKGWVGLECSERMCAPNYYGENCTKTCECNDQNTEMYVFFA